MSCDNLFSFQISWRSNHNKRAATSEKQHPKARNTFLRHASAKHDLVNKVKLETNELLELNKETASKLNSGDWFSSNVRNCWRNITSDSEKVETLLEL